MRFSFKQMLAYSVAALTVTGTAAAFDRLPTIKDTYQDIKGKPVMITESIYTIVDENGKLVELPTKRKTVKFYNWQNSSFVMIQYNDEGNPYLYEKVTFNADGLMNTSYLKTQKVSLDKTYEYTPDFSGYAIYSSSEGEKTKLNSFAIEKEDDGLVSFEYAYNPDGTIAKTKKTTGFAYSGDLRKDAKKTQPQEGTVYYYYYEDGKLSSIIMEKDTATRNRRTYYLNNKKTNDAAYELNKNGDCIKETTSATTYIYKYTYDGNKNWIQKDSFYEDKNDDIKYPHPLLRTKREIVYSGSASEPEIPVALYSFDSKDDILADIENSLKEMEKNPVKVTSAKPFTSERTDPMDDKKVLYIVFNAPQKVNEYVDNISLVIRKKEGSAPDIYINWKEFLNEGSCIVTYRIDDEKARTEEWVLSSDEKASFYDGDTNELLEKLKHATTFIARTVPFNEPPCTAVFDISSLRNLDAKYSWLYKKD
ncbi:MAG: hypothetical protein IJ828_00835 [Treponema sp.]|nr:hypothetical protein [Treponema sp.]